MPFYPDYKPEDGQVDIAGRPFEISRIVTQKKQFFEIGGRFVMGEFWEVMDETKNMGFLQVEGKWIEGHTQLRRWKGEAGRAERQTVFISNDQTVSIVVSSVPITV